MLPPGSAVRLALAKPKEGATAKLTQMLGEAKASTMALVMQLSFGENFSSAKAKGYSVGLLAMFPSVEELDAMDVE
ncbi:hypothetical protein Cni_G09259 [Canna indica]|uniref:Stress-response A/B barrel domain-containing protein n=1 Tax=Canna indica TaxID=4628 RepID=A0AAQ3Q6C1_9LILI|nr:hypothetical protein Cni_G09259 [Canna indica]